MNWFHIMTRYDFIETSRMILSNVRNDSNICHLDLVPYLVSLVICLHIGSSRSIKGGAVLGLYKSGELQIRHQTVLLNISKLKYKIVSNTPTHYLCNYNFLSINLNPKCNSYPFSCNYTIYTIPFLMWLTGLHWYRCTHSEKQTCFHKWIIQKDL